MDLLEFLSQTRGKWIAIVGNRWIDQKTASKVESVTKTLIRRGFKIVTGGAEGADHSAMRACLKYKIPKGHLKVFLPYTIQKQYNHYRKLEGSKKAEQLLATLLEIKKHIPNAIVENHRHFSNYREAANSRNTLLLRQASGVIIFKPSGSKGTLDALKKIKSRKIPFLIFP